MKPLNEKVRNEKYYQFITLYFLSVIVIIIAVMFNQSVYKKDYRENRKKLKEYESGSATPEEILAITSTIDGEIKKMDVNSSDYNIKLAQETVAENIVRLRKMAGDSTLQSRIIVELCSGYGELIEAKAKQIECTKTQSGNETNIKNLTEKLTEIKSKLDQANMTLRANALPAIN